MATSHSLQEGSQCGLEDHTGKQKVTPPLSVDGSMVLIRSSQRQPHEVGADSHPDHSQNAPEPGLLSDHPRRDHQGHPENKQSLVASPARNTLSSLVTSDGISKPGVVNEPVMEFVRTAGVAASSKQ